MCLLPFWGLAAPGGRKKGQILVFLSCANFSMWHCDELLNPDNRETYCNEALGHASCIDHVFVSNATKGNITKHEVLMMENNFSDHRPIHIGFDLCLSDKLIGSARTLKDVKHYVTRWDKCNLNIMMPRVFVLRMSLSTLSMPGAQTINVMMHSIDMQ